MPAFTLSETTGRLIKYLRAFDKGTRIPYDELSTVAEAPIEASSHNLRSALWILERDHHQVWVSIRPRVGIYRLQDHEIAHRLPTWWLNGARRKLHRGGDQSSIVDPAKLDISDQARFSVDCIQRELAAQSLSRASRRQLEKVARGNSNDLPSFNVLEWAITMMRGKHDV